MIQRVLKAFGYRLQSIPKDIALKNGINDETGGDDISLPSRITVDTIIDVGVAGGTPWLYRQFPDQKLILVEPLNVVPSLMNLIEGRDYEMFECAVGSKQGDVTINYDKTRPSLSSVKSRTQLTQRKGHEIVSKTVPVRTLDSILAESKFPNQNLGLKIDTEGYELEVLKGSVNLLKKCQFIVCEASVAKRFEDSYSFSELIQFMAENGFRLSNILRFNVGSNGVVRMVDVLFEPIGGN